MNPLDRKIRAWNARHEVGDFVVYIKDDQKRIGDIYHRANERGTVTVFPQRIVGEGKINHLRQGSMDKVVFANLKDIEEDDEALKEYLIHFEGR